MRGLSTWVLRLVAGRRWRSGVARAQSLASTCCRWTRSRARRWLLGDFNDPEMPERLTSVLGSRADLVLSDMAPNTTGHAATDHLRIMALAELAAAFAREVLAPNGAFVAKVFQGGSERAMLEGLKRDFASVRHAKPPASRKKSSELYVVATGFRGVATSS